MTLIRGVIGSQQFKWAGAPCAWPLAWFRDVSSDLNLVPDISIMGFRPLLLLGLGPSYSQEGCLRQNHF